MKGASHTLVIVLAAMFAIGANVTAARAHTFHTSLMQVEYNEAEQLVEISIQVFTHDLEDVLSRRNHKSVRLDKTPNARQLTLSYLNEVVNLKDGDGRIKNLSWVGMETQADAVWIYVETKMPEGIGQASLRNRIFFDLVNDQVDLVHIKYGGKKYDLVFKSGDNYKAITSASLVVK